MFTTEMNLLQMQRQEQTRSIMLQLHQLRGDLAFAYSMATLLYPDFKDELKVIYEAARHPSRFPHELRESILYFNTFKPALHA